MSESTNAVLIFLAGQFSLLGIEWFRQWYAVRNQNRIIFRQQRIAALETYQTELHRSSEVLLRCLNRRLHFHVWNPDDYADADEAERLVNESGPALSMTVLCAVRTRSKTLMKLNNDLLKTFLPVGDFTVNDPKMFTDARQSFSQAVQLAWYEAEQELAKLEKRKKE